MAVAQYTAPDLGPPHGPILTEHARVRWIERICSKQDGVAPWDLTDAFIEAVPVGMPKIDEQARLHSPTGALFVFTKDWSMGPRVLLTVLSILEHRVTLNDDHLTRCEVCGLRYSPARSSSCQWCSGGQHE